jgi:endonuclease IV
MDLAQFNSIMDSIYRHRTLERLTYVSDTAHAAQSTTKGMEKYMKNLRKAAGIEDTNAGDINDFFNDFGSGI